MERVFLRVLNMSLTASWAILAVLAARLLLRRAPRQYRYWLWAVVLFRLACPVSFQSAVSLIPSAQPVPMDIALQPAPKIESGLPALDAAVNAALPAAAPAVSANPLQIWQAVGTAVWALGLAALLAYTLATVVRLALDLRVARRLPGRGGEVYEVPGIHTPFVLGLARPRIYLPVGLTENEKGHILAHEHAHLRRGDHLAKALAWLLVCLHWFNPLVWISFFLMERDMEFSCDELAVRGYSPAQRKEYSMTLLKLSAGRRFVGGCPLAFGENNVKGRVINVMKLKKTTLLVSILAAVLVAVVCIGCGANPVSGSSAPASEPQSGSAAASQPGADSDGGAGEVFSGSGEFASFTGRGLTFEVPAGWTVEEVQTEDVRYYRFCAEDGTPILTYNFGEEWSTDWPIDENVLQNWYQDANYTLRALEDVTIAGAPGKKVVLEFPDENLVRIWYIAMLPDAVVTEGPESQDVVLAITLSQEFVFDCAPEQAELMEKVAGQVIASTKFESYVTNYEAQG